MRSRSVATSTGLILTLVLEWAAGLTPGGILSFLEIFFSTIIFCTKQKPCGLFETLSHTAVQQFFRFFLGYGSRFKSK